MSNEITAYTNARLSGRLKKLYEGLPEAQDEYQAAYNEGDSTDNASFESAQDKLSKMRLDISQIEELLKADVIEYDKSPVISIGSLIEVYSPSLEKGVTQTYILDSVGGVTLEGVLNTESKLGRLIKDNLSGNYSVGEVEFTVTKIREPDLPSFMSKYPEDEERFIESLFELYDVEED